MDNDTPSSSAAAVAMDVVDALRQSSAASQQHGTHFDDDELRRYFIASPQSQSGEQAAMMGMNMMGVNSSNSFAFQPSPAQSQSSNAGPPSNALETALAALGDQGRQQLLAILQLAATGNQQQQASSNAANAPFAAAGSASIPNASSASHAQASQLAAGQFSAQTQGPSSSSSDSPSNGDGSNSSGHGRDIANANAAAAALLGSQVAGLPNYYANAFKRYSAHASPQQQQSGQQNTGNTHSQQGNNASTPNSASNSSTKPSPALSAVTSHSQHVPSNSMYNVQHQQPQAQQQRPSRQQSQNSNHQHSQSQSQSYGQQNYMPTTLPNNMNFSMPDANFFRSPATFGNQGGIPGTSSTAFYSENGNPDDVDLLFTPLMSPALTASTQPGPSVGPLPESFANMTTQSQQYQQKYGDHVNGNQGVAPMTVFSPLTSPALRPQGQQQPPSGQYSNNVTSPPRTQGTNGSGKIRGASKNGPKTRPSPIIRPTIDTESQASKQSNGSNGSGGKSLSRTASINTSAPAKRSNQQSQSALPSPVSTSSFSAFPQHQYRQQSNSVPASPAFQSIGSNASSSTSNGNAKLFSNLSMTRLQENIAQTAVQNSPSPHQFDLSGVLPTFMNMPSSTPQTQNLGNSSQQPPAASSQYYGNTQQQPQRSNSGLGSLDELMALPSPLDLNNILSMLSQGNGVNPNSAEQQTNTFSPTGFQFPAGTLQQQPGSGGPPPQTGLTPFDAFLLNNYQHQHHQPPQHQHHQHQQLAGVQQESSAAQAFASHDNTLAASQAQAPAPLTPASFMNLPANQYSVLSGLLADHQQPPVSAQAGEGQNGKIRNNAPQDNRKTSKNTSRQRESLPNKQSASLHGQQQSYDAQMTTDQSTRESNYTSATSEEMQSSIALNATSPVSPAILAQNIKQVAAAAIAAKDAKSRAKAKGPSRRRASNAASQGHNGEGASEQTSENRKKAKKEGSNNGDDFSSPDKPFSLDDGPSAAPSIYGGSGPASTETSPMLAPQQDTRKSSHKVAEQRRRDSLKLCFEELRFILPPINPDEDEDFYSGPGSRRPGENNVGGQRGKNYTVDPRHPNKGISKVAMLRKSNEYVTKLHDRIDRRDAAISMLREELRLCRVALGQGLPGDEAGLDALSNVDFTELEQDNDPVPPTYRLHGLHAPGSKLSLSAATMFYQPTERTIAEDDREDDDEDDEQAECNDGGEYKAKKVKRSYASRVSTRNSRTGVEGK